MLPSLVHKIITFYINGVLNSRAKGLNNTNLLLTENLMKYTNIFCGFSAEVLKVKAVALSRCFNGLNAMIKN